MTRIRSGLLALGAAALISSQAVYAAPRSTPVSVDPLVALSAFGTLQSSASVCAAGTAAATAATTTQGTSGCLLPVQSAPPPVAEAATQPVYDSDRRPGIAGYLPLILGLVAAAIVAGIILSESNDNNEGDLTPVSPQ